MENSPSRIAADLLIAALETKNIVRTDSAQIAAIFTELHKAVHEAAKLDRAAVVGHRAG